MDGDRTNDVDRERLRSGRLARLQSAMRRHDVEACLLFNEPNIRYATGASAMPVWSNTTFVRCALVPAEGLPILFEHPNSMHLFGDLEADIRPMHAWEFTDDVGSHSEIFAREAVSAMRELGVTGHRLAVDRLGTPGFLALQGAGISIEDSAAITMEAREVKTPEEIEVMAIGGEVVMEMLHRFEAAIRPGVTERDVLAILAGTLLAGGGEHLGTNTVCSGPNTNPWRAEATARALERGDLVYVDTDSVCSGGYFFCVSRTFPCGDGSPAREQRETYRASHDWLEAMKDLVHPGVTCGELAERAPRLPAKYMPHRYECMIHGIGLEEESPSVAYPGDPQPNPDRVLEEGMALVVEVYAGEVGARHGVKLGDQIVLTADGPRNLAPYPYCAALL
jgi:Xaa-Pro aminopeptidase